MAKVIITRGRPYDLLVDMKQPSSPVGAELPATATAKFYLMDKTTGGKIILTKDMERILGIGIPEDPVDTVFKLSLTDVETLGLPYDTGFAEDGLLYVDTCRGHIAIDSPDSLELNHADTVMPSIYVADLGIGDGNQ